MVEVRSPFKYDSDGVSDDNVLICPEDTMTDQSQKEDADINTLIRRFGLSGEMPVLQRLPIQADYVASMTYKESLDALKAADAQFMELPADLRARFDHDPGKFVAFCSDEKNRDEIKRLGLLEPEAPAIVPLDVRVISEPAKA